MSPRRLLGDLRQGMADNDQGRLRMAAHTIKASANDFGAARLAAICQELEDLGRAGTLDAAKEPLGRFEAEYPFGVQGAGARDRSVPR